MGAWGYGPFESDQALDWVGDAITDPLLETLSRTLQGPPDDSNMHAIQAAAFVFVSLIGHPSRVLEVAPEAAKSHASAAIAALEGLNVCPAANDWDEPDAFRAANQELIEALRKVVEDPDQAVVGTTLFSKILSGEHG